MIGKIIDYDHKGFGLVKEEEPVFLDGGVIEDLVDYKIINSGKIKRGQINKIIKPSIFRVKSPCPYSKECGGCPLMETDYKKELEWKREKVRNNLLRIGKIETEIEEILGMEDNLHYRNNMQFKIEDGKIGLYSGKTKKIVEIKKCIIQKEIGNDILKIFQKFAKTTNIKTLGIRTNYKNQAMVIMVADSPIKKLNNIINELLELNVVSIYENINKSSKYHYGQKFKHIYGQKSLEDKIFNIKYQLSPQSFFQVNPRQVENLYKKAIENLNLEKKDKVLDLYSGIGTISLSLADKVEEVLGVEQVKEAVEDARKNAEENQIKNARFISGKVENIIDKITEEKVYNKVILDPPRSGVEKTVLERLLKLEPEKISYISCNPSTQARDLKILKEKYKVEKVMPIDMFAHSSHVECIALIQRVKS